ncbi:MAG: TnpV protein [Fretibacterium sp.]|nr:TnpV protein [Fretibacterium sp.]
MSEQYERPEWASVANGMTDEELYQAEERVWAELEAKDEEDLTIYNEEELTPEEANDLPEGSLMRKKETKALYIKVLDLWMSYGPTPKKPKEPLTKYGLMRKKYLQEWKVRTALELGENFLTHCLEVQEEAREMKASLMKELERNDPPPNKADDPMAWVQHMNALDMEAEEIVTRSLIYS